MDKIKKKSNAPILVAIFFSVFLAMIGTSTVNLAMAVLVNEFQTDLTTVNWTITGFMLAAGVAAPITGFLGNKIGNKNVCFYSIIGFIIASILCALSWNVQALIAFRIIQGMFSGFIAPATMTIIYQTFEKKKQAFAISLWGLAAMLVPAFGPTLIGFLIEKFNWTAIFWINIPIGILTAIIIHLFIPDERTESAAKFDSVGMFTSIAASVLLLVAFSKSAAWGWLSFKTIGFIVLGFIFLFIFIKREKIFHSPMLDLSVFKYKRYTFSIVISSIITISLYAGSLLTPLFLQNVQQETALAAGLILLPASLVMALIMPVIGGLYNKVGPRIFILIGIVLIALGSYKMSLLSIDTSTTYTVFWMLIRSVGISFSMIPATNAGMEVIPAELSGSASAVNNWVRQALSCLSLGVFTALLTSQTTKHATDLALSGASETLISLNAFTLSVNDVFLLSTVIIIIALPFCLILKKMPAVKTIKIEDECSKNEPQVNLNETIEP